MIAYISHCLKNVVGLHQMVQWFPNVVKLKMALWYSGIMSIKLCTLKFTTINPKTMMTVKSFSVIHDFFHHSTEIPKFLLHLISVAILSNIPKNQVLSMCGVWSYVLSKIFSLIIPCILNKGLWEKEHKSPTL